MEIENLPIDGIKLIRYDIHKDTRGYTCKPFSSEEMQRSGLTFEIKEVFLSFSRKNVIRGMHFQVPPNSQEKIVNVIKGKIIDVLLDIRTNSSTYGKYISLEMGKMDGTSVYVPQGVAHGFLSLERDNIISYLLNSPYSSSGEKGIRYDSFGYKWPTNSPTLSNRDYAFEKFNEFVSPFKM